MFRCPQGEGDAARLGRRGTNKISGSKKCGVSSLLREIAFRLFHRYLSYQSCLFLFSLRVFVALHVIYRAAPDFSFTPIKEKETFCKLAQSFTFHFPSLLQNRSPLRTSLAPSICDISAYTKCNSQWTYSAVYFVTTVHRHISYSFKRGQISTIFFRYLPTSAAHTSTVQTDDKRYTGEGKHICFVVDYPFKLYAQCVGKGTVTDTLIRAAQNDRWAEPEHFLWW